MINANSTITRCVRTALTTLCTEITVPLGHNTESLQPIAAASAPTTPYNLSQALDQVVSLLDPQHADAILALKPDATAPGDASMVQNLLTNILQQKVGTPPTKRAPANTR